MLQYFLYPFLFKKENQRIYKLFKTKIELLKRMVKRSFLNFVLIFISLAVFAQPGQLNVSRITQMPDLPAPLMIRNWHAVTLNYDTFVFNLGKTDQYLPLARIGTTGE